jgi:hypothetical protein
MNSLDGRLKKLEAALRIDEAAAIRALVDYVFAQPAAAQASFWRVWRTRWGTAEEKAQAAEWCAGLLRVTVSDRAVFQRIVDGYFGNDGRPPVGPTVDPAPALELA